MDLEPFKLSFDMAVMECGLEEDTEEAKEFMSRGEGNFICPAWLLLFRG
jgi:hypothetical protein